jgi:hypothetical protein
VLWWLHVESVHFWCWGWGTGLFRAPPPPLSLPPPPPRRLAPHLSYLIHNYPYTPVHPSISLCDPPRPPRPLFIPPPPPPPHRRRPLHFVAVQRVSLLAMVRPRWCGMGWMRWALLCGAGCMRWSAGLHLPSTSTTTPSWYGNPNPTHTPNPTPNPKTTITPNPTPAFQLNCNPTPAFQLNCNPTPAFQLNCNPKLAQPFHYLRVGCTDQALCRHR